MNSALYLGTVMHARRSPRRNVFRYPVYMTLIDLAELPQLDRGLRLFGWNRRGLTSYHDADHIDIHETLARHGIDLGHGGSIQVLTNLRVLGYVFNPVSFWWCRRSDGALACIVAEVNNTFGERHAYVLAAADGIEEGAWTAYPTEKLLHVSPFMPMEQTYTWRFSELGERLDVRIDVREPGSQDFHATLTARRVPLTAASLRAVLCRYPLMPVRVIWRIHRQAARLWLRKRLRVHHKPPFVPGQGTVKR